MNLGFSLPRDDSRFHWTSHIKSKMVFYRISEQKIRTVLKSPVRREKGIAPETVTAMKRNDTPKRKEEIWIMYRPAAQKPKAGGALIMISAWRYPGVTKIGAPIPVPSDIIAELRDAGYIAGPKR